MLFNSPAFIFLFLPLVFAGFFLAARYLPLAAAAGLLTLASFAFYAWWSPAYLLLLLASIAFNFMVGRALSLRSATGRQDAARSLLWLGLGANLALLGYYKYANFFLGVAGSVAGARWQLGEILLPLGISFYTFTQIAYLVDAWKGRAREYNPVHYALFVSYFPHLVAGPILHHGEMMPQFADRSIYRVDAEGIAVGCSIFAVGLFKKVILADGIAPFANNGFGAAALGVQLTWFEAWGAALAYTAQLYFDFSGYSDMAVGISRLFGVQLPVNFHSPYKAASIIEFWRRWHMTLSRFLRDYLYIPLGGNRHGRARRYTNLMLTMALGGLWHGAGWTFIAWGVLHGVYLVVNHAWAALPPFPGAARMRGGRIAKLASWLLTFLCVVVAWVFFRANSMDTALSILGGMLGLNGVVLPSSAIAKLGPAGSWLSQLGVASGDMTAYGGGVQLAWTFGLLALAFLAPNTQQLMAGFRPGLGRIDDTPGTRARIQWRPTTGWAMAVAAVLFAALLNINRASDFLYWQF